jgi:hypothetical protein
MTSEHSATEDLSRAIEPVSAALTASANALLDSLVRAPARDIVGEDDASPAAQAHRLFREARDAFRPLGLPGPLVLIDALDALFGQLRRQRREPDRDTALAITDAYQALLGYLGEAAAGPLPPAMRLYAYYSAVMQFAGQPAPPAINLFFPDLAPLAALPAPPAAPLDVGSWRAAFDKALLSFLRDGGAQHLYAMRDVAAAAAGAQDDPLARAGWRVLHAFIDNAATEFTTTAAAPPLELKRLLGAINTRLRHFGEPVPDSLLRPVLYRLADRAPLAPSARMVAATLDLAAQAAGRDARRYDAAIDYVPAAPVPVAAPAPVSFSLADDAIDFAPAGIDTDDATPALPAPSAAALDDFIAASDRAVLRLCEDLAQWRAAPDRPAVLQAIAHLQGMREGAAGVGCTPLRDLALALEMVLRSIPEHPSADLIGAAELDIIGRAVESVSGMLQALAIGAGVRADSAIVLELAQLQFAVEKAALAPFSAQALDDAAAPQLQPEPEPEPEPEMVRGAALGDMATGLSDTLAALMAEGEHRLDAGPAAPDVAPARDGLATIEDHFEPVQLAALTRNGGARLHEIGQNLKAWRQGPADQAYAARLVAQLQALHEAARAGGALRLAFALYEIEIQIEMYLDTSSPGDNAPSALFDSLLAHYAECTQLFEQLPRS